MKSQENDILSGIWPESEPYFASFYKEFTLPRDTAKAFIDATALSPEPARQFVYNLTVNGTELGVGPSRIDMQNGKQVLYYNTYDISGLVKPENGANWVEALCHTAEGKLFYALLRFYDDGGNELGRISTDASWQCFDMDPVFRPDNSIGTHYYKAYAANIDLTARGEIRKTVIKEIDGYTLTPGKTGPVKRFGRDAAPENIRPIDGGYFIDLGREIVGGIEIGFRTKNVTDISAGFGEELNPDGSVRSAMRTGNIYRESWRVPAGKSEIRTPDMFTYRYVELKSDLPFSVEYVRGLRLGLELDDSESSFDSDNQLLKELYDFTKYTVKATTQDLYVDSQSRERGAYEGDLLINMLASYTFYSETAVPRFTFEYLCTHRTWPAEYILLMPYICFLDLMQTGDLSAARRHYSVLKECNFAALKGPQGLVQSGNTGAQGLNAVLYDWPPSQRDGYDTGVLYPTVLNALQVKSFVSMAEISGYLGFDADRLYYLAAAGELAAAVNDTLYDSEKGAFCDGLYADGTRSTHFSQHASAYALWGLGNAFLRPDQLSGVCEYIRSAKGLKTSVYGAFFLLDGLYRSGVPGAAALATSLMLSERPGDMYTWTYMMHELGATISAEAWSPALKPNSTFSHPWGAAPAALIARGIFGIEPLEPGYSRFRVNFRRAGIGRASIVLPTPRGPISASFCGDNYSVTGPEGCEIEVLVDSCK